MQKKILTIPSQIKTFIVSHKTSREGEQVYHIVFVGTTKVSYLMPRGIEVMLEKNKLTFTTTSKKQNLKLLGLSLADLENSLTAVSEGFLKNVFLVGVGYKFILEKDFLQVQIGRANTYDFKLPKNLKIDMIGPQTINC